jgi:alpha-tubulin suppressor-like RCC1 family protein
MPQWKQYSGMWASEAQMQAVAAGTWTGVTLTSLYSWGSNNNGQLAQNNLIGLSSPVQIGSSTDWGLKNAASGYVRFFIKQNGTLWTVGSNTNGTLGLNDRVNRSSPTQIGALTTWLSVSTGSYNGSSFAIKNDGTLWSWGQNNNGQLGQNDLVYRSSPTQVGAGTTWQQVCGLETAAYAIKTDGTLWSWGSGGNGRLGLNDTVGRSSPTQVGALTDWLLLPSGGYNPTASISVIKTNNTLWSWGSNNNGQLGDNTVDSKSSPIQIGALTNWSKIQAGLAFRFSLKTDGTIWAWGRNANGALGQNNIANRSSPVQIGALTTWSEIAANSSSVGAVKTDGTLWTWGQNVTGELAQNDLVYRSSPTQVGSDTNWTSIIGGDLYGFVGIKRTTT